MINKTIRKIIKTISIITSVNIISLFGYIQYKTNSKKKLNIIFDLDETLIHSEKISNLKNYNKSNMSFPDITNLSGRDIWIRPGVLMLLPIISKFNNVYLFTKATKPYTDEILSNVKIDKYFIDLKYRDECHGIPKNLLKYNIDLDNSILIDDKLSNKYENQNLYHIPRFNSYVKYDLEMFKLFGFILCANIKKDLGIGNK